MEAPRPPPSTASRASSASPACALELSGIDKRFGGVHALRGATLEARPGEILGLCGENGAGKSTLLKILAGVHPHGSFTGEVRVAGEARRFATTRDAERAGIAIVHQELMLVPELSVAENLSLGREPSSAFAPFRALGLLDDEAVEARAGALLARFGVDREIDVRATAGSLGIGRQQVVEIVRALDPREHEGARVLVLDEPTAALTGREASRLFEWLRELRRAGTTCLYVSHRLDEIFALCDRVTVLRDGRTVTTLDIASTSPDAVVEAMVGRAAVRAPATDRAATAATDDAASAAPALEVTDLRVPDARSSGDDALLRMAIDGVSFTLAAGEIVGLAGAMGSGRTALLSTLFGCAERGYAGAIRIAGAEATLGAPRDAIAHGLAFVPEDRKGKGLVLGLSVEENLDLPQVSWIMGRRGRARGLVPAVRELFALVDDEAAERTAMARIDELRIRGAHHHEAMTLSGGNQQKVVLGKWLGSPPRVLLLDEPTRGVDVGAREEIYGILEALAARGTAVLFASSDLPEVRRLAHRVLVLRRGTVAADLTAADATEAAIVGIATGAAS